MSDAVTRNTRAEPARAPQAGIPGAKTERDRLLRHVRDYVTSERLIPPQSQAELVAHARRIAGDVRFGEEFHNYVGVLINNEVWRDTVARTPYNRRLLLLPQCLRHEIDCPAQLDEFGLVCESCGRCQIGKLQDLAEQLGYVVLVAEGTAVVTALVGAGKIDAIVGVSCLSVLKRIFPKMETAVIPGVAIPLLYDGCADTMADTDWVLDAITMNGNGAPRHSFRRLDLDRLRGSVTSWFTPGSLEAVLGVPGSRTERIAHAWLARSGKRWRPFLTASIFHALLDDPDKQVPRGLHELAVAVECFHKASLIHDDIEDDDELRYGEKTLHEEYGTPIALNVGDLLLGEGYRLIAETDAPPDRKAQMLSVAAEGHRTLSIGQGEELSWRREPRPLSVAQVIDIFRRKTAPAFDVALQVGAIYAGVNGNTRSVLSAYSEALGIAYQIRDDMEDCPLEDPDGAESPSLRLAVACERAAGDARNLLDNVWRQTIEVAPNAQRVRSIFDELGIEAAIRQLLCDYEEEAIGSLRDLRNATLKALLRRVIGSIFYDIETKERPGDVAAGDASGGAIRSETTT